MTARQKHERIEALYTFINNTYHSGWVDSKPIIAEIAKLLNLKEVIREARVTKN